MLRNGTIAAALALTFALAPSAPLALTALAEGTAPGGQPQPAATDGIALNQRLAQTARWGVLAHEVSNATGVPTPILRAIISVETGGEPGAYDLGTGGIGLMLVEPEVKLATSYGYHGNLWDPETNLRVAAEYLALARQRWGSWELAVAAYALRDQNLVGHPWPAAYMDAYHATLTALGYTTPAEEATGIAFGAALQMLGRPYVPAGHAPETGFDCSGLVWWAYQQIGRNLPRDTGGQMAATTPIDATQLRPGDLVFFADGGTVFHVGLYAGDGLMLHAPREGETVEFANLSEAYWSGYLAGYGRVS